MQSIFLLFGFCKCTQRELPLKDPVFGVFTVFARSRFDSAQVLSEVNTVSFCGSFLCVLWKTKRICVPFVSFHSVSFSNAITPCFFHRKTQRFDVRIFRRVRIKQSQAEPRSIRASQAQLVECSDDVYSNHFEAHVIFFLLLVSGSKPFCAKYSQCGEIIGGNRRTRGGTFKMDRTIGGYANMERHGVSQLLRPQRHQQQQQLTQSRQQPQQPRPHRHQQVQQQRHQQLQQA